MGRQRGEDPDEELHANPGEGCVVPFVIIISGIAGMFAGFGMLLNHFV